MKEQVLNDSKYNPKILFQILLDTAQFEFTLKEVRLVSSVLGNVNDDWENMEKKGTHWASVLCRQTEINARVIPKPSSQLCFSLGVFSLWSISTQ